jgi:small-conductance mechanosensitive channel
MPVVNVLIALTVMLAALLAPAGNVHARSMEGKAWRQVLDGIGKDLDRRAKEVEDIRRLLPGLRAEAEASLAWADNRLTQALILRGMAGRTPWALRTLNIQYKSIGSFLNSSALNLELAREHLTRIKDENSTLKEIRHKGSGQSYNDATVAALAEPARKLEGLKAEVDGLKEEIDQALTGFKSLHRDLESLMKDFRDDYIKTFRKYFFSHSRPPLDEYGMILLQSEFESWAADFPRFMGPVLAWTDRAALLKTALPIWLALWALGSLAAARLGVWRDARERWGWLLFSLGAGVLLALSFTAFGSNHVVVLASTVVAGWGGVLLAGGRLPGGELAFWFGLYGAGAIAQAADLPPELVNVYWAAVMLPAAYPRHLAGAKRQALALAALGIFSLAGFGPQGVILVQAWFLLRLTVAAARGIREFMAGRGGAWLTYAHPFLMAVLCVAYLAWLFLFMGGPGFMEHVFTLEVALGPARLSLDALAAMVLLFFAVRLGLAWFSAFLDRGGFAAAPLDQALTHTLSTLAAYAAWVAYLLAALGILGLPLTGLTWIASGLSVGVGFGLKDIINNFVSGLIILFGGSIKKGDVVQTGKLIGEVTAVSVRNTTVRTMDNSMVIIPNSSFLKGEIINWSYQDKRIRLTIPVNVIPGTKVKKVRKILMNAAEEHKLVLGDPAPSVLLRQLGKMGLEFELYVWIEDFRNKFRVESDLASEIDRALQENKITVAFQSAKVKYKAKGTEEAQREAAREALRAKRREVFKLVRPLRNVHMRARWGVPAGIARKDDE